MSDRRVAVLSGGLSHEREVSLRSGRRVSTALRECGLSVAEWDADAALLGRLAAERPHAVLVALHGGKGENGAVQTVLEMLGVPFVGSRSAACRRAWDKPTAKAELARNGLGTPEWVVLPNTTFRELGARAVLDAMTSRLGLPMILKPDAGGSSLGVQVVRDPADLPAAMVACLGYGETVLAERFVEGVEVAVTVVDGDGGPAALPAVEIVPGQGIYDYAARYTAGLTDFHTPARLDPEVSARVGELAVRAHRLLGLGDLSRADAVVTAGGEVEFLEMNSSPGLTETSLLPMAAEAAGLPLGPLFADLLERAIARGY
jgi:D-alanine-D-alanine ligase